MDYLLESLVIISKIQISWKKLCQQQAIVAYMSYIESLCMYVADLLLCMSYMCSNEHFKMF